MNPTVIWVILLIIFCVFEGMTAGLVSIWFAAGAAVALIASGLTDNIWVQIILFLVVSCVVLLLLRPIVRKRLSPKQEATNADRVIGAEGIVKEEICNLKNEGQISVLGSVWTARTQEQDQTIPVGAIVRVLRIEGVKLIVVPEPGQREEKC
ncbi:MAG: NfeD family protein [Oscillospiraceae bacterium]|nr:NfeD family protein [Oscillospiraceae bacterium]